MINDEFYNKDYKKSYSNYIIGEEKKYSLLPDMLSGWRPSLPILQFCKKITLDFKSPFDDYFKTLIKNKDPSIAYIGPRPYDNQIIQNLIKKLPKKEEIQKNDKLQFDSNFQSGNLDFVTQKEPNQYQLWMRCDSNSQHTQWFYFKVKNTKQLQLVNFTIHNFYKKKSAYEMGMKPFIKSKKLGNTWVQDGEQIKYFEDQKLTNKQFFSLSFQYKFLYDNDEVSFAYCIPYTYTKLNKYLNNIMNNYESIIIKQNLCNTASNVQCPLLTITNQQSELEKQTILISARIHPGETNSSFVMEGLINYLVSEKAKNLRNHINFKIIPMLNPDGVIIGNYRCGIMGYDYNREFKETQNNFPTISALMNLAKNLKDKENLIMYIDLHGHSIKRNVFAYGPKFDQNLPQYYECRVLPKMISKCTDMFKYCQCRFNEVKEKSQTGRMCIQNLCQLTNCYTIESSFGCFVNKHGQQELFDKPQFINMGKNIGVALDLFIKAKIQEKIFCPISKQIKQKSFRIKDVQKSQDSKKIVRKYNSSFHIPKSQQNNEKFNYYKNLYESIEVQDYEYQNQSDSHDEHSDSDNEIQPQKNNKNKQKKTIQINQVQNTKLPQQSFIEQNKNSINEIQKKKQNKIQKQYRSISNANVSIFPTQFININQQQKKQVKQINNQKSQKYTVKKILQYDSQEKAKKTQTQQQFFQDNKMMVKNQVFKDESYKFIQIFQDNKQSLKLN